MRQQQFVFFRITAVMPPIHADYTRRYIRQRHAPKRAPLIFPRRYTVTALRTRAPPRAMPPPPCLSRAARKLAIILAHARRRRRDGTEPLMRAHAFTPTDAVTPAAIRHFLMKKTRERKRLRRVLLFFCATRRFMRQIYRRRHTLPPCRHSAR